jgi:hypothetical protein
MRPMTKVPAAAEALLDVQDLVEAVRSHDLYANVRDDRSLRLLMRAHVFAVWDFQSLLKALQQAVTCVHVPWLPTSDPEARRFVNEIVLDEESDVCPWGGHLSHFELYRRAMLECGADAGPIDTFIDALKAGRTVDDALDVSGTSEGVKDFVRTTMGIAQGRSPHRIAAAFSFGREDIIPQMFQRLVDSLAKAQPDHWSTFQYYLVRHISNDADKHGPLARNLVGRLCGADAKLKSEAQAAARSCLQARIALWDEVLRDIRGGS